MLKDYLLLGVGVYLGCASARVDTFKKATFLKLLLGLFLGLFLWPLGLVISTLASLDNKK